MSPTSRSGVPVLWAALLLSAPAVAQVPDGWYVVSSFAANGYPGGLQLVRPGSLNVVQNVLGLGHDLTGSPEASYVGAHAVLYRPGDGALIVGEVATSSEPSLDIHVITLKGFDVASDVAHFISATSPQLVCRITQMALLPPGPALGEVLFTGVIATGCMGLAILNTTTGVVTAVPVGGLGGCIEGLAMDRTGTTAYVGIGPNLYSVPVPGGGIATLVASLPYGSIVQLAVDNDDHPPAKSVRSIR